MANEPLALVRQRPPDPGSEDDYQSFCATLGSSARGRAFLDEYARRNRHADTEVLLAALDRLEVQMRGQAADDGRMRGELLALHDAIHAARVAIDDGDAANRASRLAALIDETERHIAGMLAPAQNERDLAIPSPANDEPHSSAQVIRSHASRASAMLPELNYFDGAAAALPPVEARAEMPPATAVPVAAPAVPPPAIVAAPAAAESDTAMAAFAAQIELPVAVDDDQPGETKTEKPARDPLAAIMALSEDERLALFT